VTRPGGKLSAVVALALFDSAAAFSPASTARTAKKYLVAPERPATVMVSALPAARGAGQAGDGGGGSPVGGVDAPAGPAQFIAGRRVPAAAGRRPGR